MIFRDMAGQPWLTLHSPNQKLKERPVFIPLKVREDGLLAKN